MQSKDFFYILVALKGSPFIDGGQGIFKMIKILASLARSDMTYQQAVEDFSFTGNIHSILIKTLFSLWNSVMFVNGDIDHCSVEARSP